VHAYLLYQSGQEEVTSKNTKVYFFNYRLFFEAVAQLVEQ